MFENTSNLLTATVGGTGRIAAGTGIKYTGTGIRKIGEFLVAGGTWLEAQGAVMAAKGKAVKMISSGQLTVLGAAALAAGQNPVEVMVAEILSGEPLNIVGAAPVQPVQQQQPKPATATEATTEQEIPPAELAADLC